MKKNILIYGLIAGIVVTIPMIIMVNSETNSENGADFSKGLIIGYTSMLIAFSLVFVGIRNYRNNYLGGTISFGKAFSIGGLIVLIASTIYVGVWLIDFYYFIPNFAEKYGAHVIAQMKADGASQEEIQKSTKEMADFAVKYKNPLYNAMISYTEILPVGLIVTLISSLILKKKKAA